MSYYSIGALISALSDLLSESGNIELIFDAYLVVIAFLVTAFVDC
ncbi:hypothetical protein [Domibacillus mangrovi]|nr:hypothetical protein [Domibacillus mangrovi]